MAPPLADLEGKYEIVAKMKEGGMGAIYKVRHRLLDEIRVVKVLRPQHEDDEELRHRFAREAKAAIRLRHPNIVQIFDFSVDDSGTGLIVMEYIDGADLGHLIRTDQRPSVPLALEIARQSLQALGFLHKKGFVHRDVSPDNLMLTVDVEGKPLVKLIDLGIAKDHEAEQSLTTSGSFLGKFRYASPEHFGSRGPDGIEARSDLYTFGLVFYEVLTGHYPLPGESTSQLIGAHLFEPPKSFDTTDPEARVPPAVRTMVTRALEKKVEDRFANAEGWIAEISKVLDRSPLGATLAVEARRLAVPPPVAISSNDVESTQLRFDRLFGIEKTPRPAATVQEPSTIDALLSGAEALLRLGQRESARGQIETVLGLDPQNADALRLLDTLEANDAGEAETASQSEIQPPPLPSRTPPPLPPSLATTPEATTARDAPDASRETQRRRLEKLLAEAEARVDAGEYPVALALLRDAREGLSAESPLVADLTRGVETIRRRIEARERPPLELDEDSSLLHTIAEIERLRVEEDPKLAWRAVGQAIAHFGEKSLLVELRRGLAEDLGETTETDPGSPDEA